MKGLQDIVDTTEFVKRLESVLDEVLQYGVRWRGTRFDAYLEVLREAASFTYPCPFPWRDDREKMRLFFEATSQIQQLVDAMRVLREAPSEVAKEKLEKALRGTLMPPTESDESDLPRNTLCEIATAVALKNKGFLVSLTTQDEDVRATYPGLVLPFVVECKRPTHAHSVKKNLKKIRRQLRDRQQAGGSYGLAVIGIDRVVELPGATPGVERESELFARIDAELRREIGRIRKIDAGSKDKLFPYASIGGVLLTGSVFLADRGGMFTVSQMGLFCTAREDHHVSMTIKRALAATIETT